MSKNITINEQYHREMKLESVITGKPISEILDNILDKHYTKERVELIRGKLK